MAAVHKRFVLLFHNLIGRQSSRRGLHFPGSLAARWSHLTKFWPITGGQEDHKSSRLALELGVTAHLRIHGVSVSPWP